MSVQSKDGLGSRVQSPEQKCSPESRAESLEQKTENMTVAACLWTLDP